MSDLDEIQRLERELSGLGVDVSDYGKGATPKAPPAFVPSFPENPQPIFRHEFGKPIPLPRGLLPAPVEALAFELEEKHGVDRSVFSFTALATVGALLGNRRRLRVSRDQTIRANLYLAVVASPAMMKSPTMSRATRPAVWIEKQTRELREEDLKKHERDLLLWTAEKAQLEKRLKTARGQEADEIADRLQTGAPVLPPFPQILISDATPEALVMGLQDNPNGVFLYVDELQFLLNQTGKKGFETLRQLLLEFFEAYKPFIDNRLSRKSFFVPSPLLSIAGGIQEDRTAQFIEVSDDGLVERFVFVVPPVAPWLDPEDPVDAELEDFYFRAVLAVPGAVPQQVGCTFDEAGGYWYHDLDQDARGLWRAWRNFTEEVKRLPVWQGRPKLHGWFGKMRTLAGKFALVIHATEGHAGPVTADTLGRGILLAVVAFSHAEAAFGRFGGEGLDVVDPPEVRLFELLKSGETESFRAKDIYDRQRAGMGRESVEAGIGALLAAGWLCPERLNTMGGRPSVRYHVNPKIDTAHLAGLAGSFWESTIQNHFLKAFEKYPSLAGFDGNVSKSKYNMDIYYIYNKSIDIPTDHQKSTEILESENEPAIPAKCAGNEEGAPDMSLEQEILNTLTRAPLKLPELRDRLPGVDLGRVTEAACALVDSGRLQLTEQGALALGGGEENHD